MLKNRKILLGILVILLLLVLPNVVKADNNNPTVKTEVSGANKSIKVILEDIELDDEQKQYQFGISKAKATEPTEWSELQEIEANTCTAIITPDNEDMRIILRSNNKCYLFIKEKENEDEVIITQVNLPDLLDIKVNTSNKFEINYLYEKCNAFYENLGNYQITAVKIDDKDIIKKYLSAKEKNQNTLNAVKEMLPTEKPTNTWSKMNSGNSFTYTSADYSIKDLIKYEGLYMVWGQVSYKEGRSIYGYTLYDNYPDGYKLPEEGESGNETQETNDKTFNNHKYRIIEKTMSWDGAKYYCIGMGGYLVTITSKEEQAFLESFIKEQGFTQNRFWIGATDKKKEGTWKWVTEKNLVIQIGDKVNPTIQIKEKDKII